MCVCRSAPLCVWQIAEVQLEIHFIFYAATFAASSSAAAAAAAANEYCMTEIIKLKCNKQTRE